MGHALANFAFATVLTSSFALLAFSKCRRVQIASLTDLLCICRCICLISTVLSFAGLQGAASSHYPLPCLYGICRFDFWGSTVLGFVCYPKALMSLDSPLTEYTAIALPQDLFSQLIGENVLMKTALHPCKARLQGVSFFKQFGGLTKEVEKIQRKRIASQTGYSLKKHSSQYREKKEFSAIQVCMRGSLSPILANSDGGKNCKNQ